MLDCRAAVEGFLLDSGWRTYAGDSIAPAVTFQHRLDEYRPDMEFRVDIEYPELVPLSDSQLESWKLNADDIPEWPQIRHGIGVSRGEAVVDVAFMPLLRRDGKVFAIESFKLVIGHAGAVSAREGGNAAAAEPAGRYTRRSVLSSGKWVKVKVASNGIFKLSDSRLRSMGFSDPSKVRMFGYGGNVLPETGLQNLTDDLPEQPLWRGDGYYLFYAKGPVSMEWNGSMLFHKTNTYSDYGCYFLTDCAVDSIETQPKRFITDFADSLADTLDGFLTGTVVDSYPDCVFIDDDQYSWYRSGRRFFEKYDYAASGSRVYHLDTKDMTGGKVSLTVAFSAASSFPTVLKAAMEGKQVGQMNIGPLGGNSVAELAENTFQADVTVSDELSVKLTHERPEGTEAHLDFLRLNFRRRIAMRGAGVEFRTDADADSVSFLVDRSSADVQIWKISPEGDGTVIPSSYGNGRTLTAAGNYSADDVLLAVNVRGSFPEPEVVGTVGNQNLHGLDSVDMVIVVPASGKLTAQAERLAGAHASLDGLSVSVVSADKIYNEFSSGTPDATAIRRFMKMLYDRGNQQGGPRYLLLMGGGAWDNRMHTSDFSGYDPDDYLLCYESENSLSHTASYVMEDYFGLLDDAEGKDLLIEKTDLGVGRLPVTDIAGAKAAVDKIIDYMTGRYAGKWCNEILVLGDDGDNNDHMEAADAVATLYEKLYPSVDVTKIYWDAYPMEVSASYNGYPAVRSLILDKLDAGALIVNYSGHGSMDVLSHELVMNKTDMRELGSPRLPFWITASCDIAPFDSPLESLGCNLMHNAKGGAIGLLSTTRTVYSSLNRLINRSFSKYVLAKDGQGRRYALGDALRLAKNELVTIGGSSDMSENKLHYVLLGDPALKLGMAEYTAVVDSFAQAGAGSAELTAQAGNVISVSGHIERDGVPQPDFNGLIYNTVYDSERQVTTFNNLKTAQEPFEFMIRDRVLAMGCDSVRDGGFSFSFPVPMDINYSNESGRISLYALSSDHAMAANGVFENFRVGGTAGDMSADTIGPSISMYLNTPYFQYGAKVNPSPTLVVELSDESGLNTSGNGLGHDIMLVVDGERKYTWILNRLFQQAGGDWTKGRIVFNIPELPEGQHTLMLRAWDTRNNSSRAYLGFNVIKDLKPELSVDVTASPAHGQTTFVIGHDRPCRDAAVTVQVYDTKGMLQWTHTVNDSSEAGTVLVDWNLCDNSGRSLPAGLYVARVTLTADDRTRSAQCKLVIAAR